MVEGNLIEPGANIETTDIELARNARSGTLKDAEVARNSEGENKLA